MTVTVGSTILQDLFWETRAQYVSFNVRLIAVLDDPSDEDDLIEIPKDCCRSCRI